VNREIEQTILLHLGRVEGKVDALLSNQDQMRQRLDSHEKRISALEMYRAWQMGASAAIASVVAWAVGFFKGG
jgi:hypothetical protein